jgi:hypothetical protein
LGVVQRLAAIAYLPISASRQFMEVPADVVWAVPPITDVAVTNVKYCVPAKNLAQRLPSLPQTSSRIAPCRSIILKIERRSTMSKIERNDKLTLASHVAGGPIDLRMPAGITVFLGGQTYGRTHSS